MSPDMSDWRQLLEASGEDRGARGEGCWDGLVMSAVGTARLSTRRAWFSRALAGWDALCVSQL